jgi:hypothetical protein
MRPSHIQSFTNVQADPASPGGAFVAGLLDPAAPIPKTVLGQMPRRYAVYRNNVTISLIRAMESNFPVVRRLLGEQYFAGLAREFVQRHPPTSPLMFHYGAAFSDYIGMQEDLRDYPYLNDIAKLEQQIRLSYHEADAPILLPNALTQIAEDELMQTRYVPHPAMAIIESDFAIHSIYSANQKEAAGTIEDVSTSESVLIVRPKYDVELHSLNTSQCVFLKSLSAGRPLAAAADAAFEASEDFDLNGAISLLLLPGAFQSIQMKKD